MSLYYLSFLQDGNRARNVDGVHFFFRFLETLIVFSGDRGFWERFPAWRWAAGRSPAPLFCPRGRGLDPHSDPFPFPRLPDRRWIISEIPWSLFEAPPRWQHNTPTYKWSPSTTKQTSNIRTGRRLVQDLSNCQQIPYNDLFDSEALRLSWSEK